MKTLIAVPCMDTMPTGFVTSLLDLVLHMGKVGEVSVQFKANSLVYDSRNLLSLIAIEQGFDRVLWIDSDMAFSRGAFELLMRDMDDSGAEMVTGVYCKRRPPYTPVIFDELDPPGTDADGKPIPHVHNYIEYPSDTIFPVKGCGFGFVLTSTKLIKQVWDKFGPAFSPLPWAGEDMSFCYRVNQLRHQILCDSRVLCGHIGQFVFMEDIIKKRGDINA